MLGNQILHKSIARPTQKVRTFDVRLIILWSAALPFRRSCCIGGNAYSIARADCNHYSTATEMTTELFHVVRKHNDLKNYRQSIWVSEIDERYQLSQNGSRFSDMHRDNDNKRSGYTADIIISYNYYYVISLYYTIILYYYIIHGWLFFPSRRGGALEVGANGCGNPLLNLLASRVTTTLTFRSLGATS